MPLVLIRITEGLGKSVVDVIELEKKKEQPKAEVKEHTVKEPALEHGSKCQVKEDSEHRLAVRLVSLAHHESVYERTLHSRVAAARSPATQRLRRAAASISTTACLNIPAATSRIISRPWAAISQPKAARICPRSP